MKKDYRFRAKPAKASKLGMAFALLGMALAFGLASCKTDTETEYVDEIVEKDVEAPIDSSDGFVKIAKGSFKRASSSTAAAYTVTLTKDFYMSDHQVTQGEWEQYMTYYGEATKNDGCRPSESYGKGENFPAYYVNWYEAVIYCNLLSEAKGLAPAYYMTINSEKVTDVAKWAEAEGSNIAKTDGGKYYYNDADDEADDDADDDTNVNSVLDNATTGILLDAAANGYRLPTEAEWEYAALGSYKDNSNWNGYNDGSNSDAYVFAGYDGSNADSIGAYVWYESNSNNAAHEVKGKLPNSCGLYDMSGNVWEWCYDWYGDYASGDVSDPTGASSDVSRVSRGGSLRSGASHCAVSCRDGNTPDARYNFLGFRVVRSSSE